MKKHKIAFVLGGGSIKGAYQIGQMYELINQGIVPDIITGISVGSLNGLLYTHYLGQEKNAKTAIAFCVSFWTNYIKQPSDIINKKSWFRIAREILTNKFTGMLKTSKLEQLIENNVNLGYVASANVDLDVGAVNMNYGMIEYCNKKSSFIKDFTLASSRIPIMMPTSSINGSEYYDGGLIDNAAIGKAIDSGADEIYVLCTHPEHVKADFSNSKSLLLLVDRIMEIVVNNTLNNDIIEALLFNELIKRKGAPGKKYIDIKVFRPEKSIDIAIESFTEKDISDMIEAGKQSITI